MVVLFTLASEKFVTTDIQLRAFIESDDVAIQQNFKLYEEYGT